MTQHRSPISSVTAFGRYIATSGYDNQIILWEKDSKRFINRGSHDHLANYVAFSPCGSWLLSAGSDYTARIWSVPGMQLHSVLAGHSDDVEHAAFSACGEFIATASRDHRVRVFHKNGTLLSTFEGHTADVLSVVWSGEDRHLVSSGDDGTIRVWDVAAGTEQAVFRFEDVETDTCSVSGLYIYAGNDRGDISIIRPDSGEAPQCIHAHGAGIKSIKIRRELGLLVSASYDRYVKLWRIDPESGALRLLREILCPAPVWLRAVHIVNERQIAFGTFGTCYVLYDTETGLWDMEGLSDTGGINAVLASGTDVFTVGDSGAVFQNGRCIANTGSLCNFLLQAGGHIVTGGQTGELFDARTGAVLYRNHAPLNCGAAWSLDGKQYAIIGTYTGEGLVFCCSEEGLEFLQAVTLHTNAVKGIATDGRLLYSVCANTDAAFHDAATLSLVSHIRGAHGLIANGADRLPGGQFVSVSRDRQMRIRSLEGCREVPTPHTHSVKCVRVSEVGDRRLVATGSYNGLCCIYDLGRDAWVYQKRLSTSGISSLSFSASANAFLASSYDGHVYQVPVAELGTVLPKP